MTNPTKATFSPKAVAAERKRLGLTLTQYAALVGVHRLTIHRWEHGRNVPKEGPLKRWHAIYGIDRAEALKALGMDPVEESAFSPGAVRAERLRLGLSVMQYAKLVGVSRPTICEWEKGANVARRATLKKWFAVKGIGKREVWQRLGVASSRRRKAPHASTR